MKINNITNIIYYPTKVPASETKKTIENQEIKDEYFPSQPQQSVKKSTYESLAPKIDTATIQRLKEESEKVYMQLRELVRQLLEKQGLSFREIESQYIKIDEETRIKAQEMISEGGPLSPEVVSDRIVEFAKAISGGDKEKIDILRDAIEKGFREAAEVLGGELPEICQITYKLVNEKLDAWIEG